MSEVIFQGTVRYSSNPGVIHADAALCIERIGNSDRVRCRVGDQTLFDAGILLDHPERFEARFLSGKRHVEFTELEAGAGRRVVLAKQVPARQVGPDLVDEDTGVFIIEEGTLLD